MVSHHPTNKLISREPIPIQKKPFPTTPCEEAGTSSIRPSFPGLSQRKGQVTHVLLTRSPLSPKVQAPMDPVRLACVKHAASVRPEPGSNSPNKNIQKTPKKGQSQPKKTKNRLTQPKKKCKAHTQKRAKNKNTLSRTKTTPPHQTTNQNSQPPGGPSRRLLSGATRNTLGRCAPQTQTILR